MKSHELAIIGVLAIGSAVALNHYWNSRPKPQPFVVPPQLRHYVRPKKNDVHDPHYVANQRFPYDNDPWNIGIPTPLKGLPMNVDTWRGTGGTNRIAKEVRNTQMLYGGHGAT